MIKVGIIGYGYSASIFHLPLIESLEQFEIVAISSSRPEEVQSKYPFVSLYSTASDLIINSSAELIVITAPNDVHFSLAKSCLEHNKHVVLEKPMVTTSDEAKELVKLAKTKSLILSVFHNRRWDGDFLTVKKIIKDGAIGNIRFFESHFDRFRPVVRSRWKEEPGNGAGIWFDLGSHLVDQAICLFGLPNSLTARCLALREKSQVTDYFHVLLHYNNLEVVLHSSSFSAGQNTRFRIEGTKGSFVKHGLDPQEAQLKEGMNPSNLEFGVEQKESFGTLYTEADIVHVETQTGYYQKYYLSIISAIRNLGDSPVSGEEALQVIKILELAEISSRESRTIKLDQYSE